MLVICSHSEDHLSAIIRILDEKVKEPLRKGPNTAENCFPTSKPLHSCGCKIAASKHLAWARSGQPQSQQAKICRHQTPAKAKRWLK